MQKLELTWVGKERRPRLEPRIRLEFADDPQQEDSQVRCKETVLSFVRLMDAAGNRTAFIDDSPAIRYNYASQTTNPLARGPAGSPSLPGLLAALKRAHAGLNCQLKRRHQIMQSLYARHFQERAKPALRSQSVNPLRIGRNEPCPCGSGRKFKQCCLNTSPS